MSKKELHETMTSIALEEVDAKEINNIEALEITMKIIKDTIKEEEEPEPEDYDDENDCSHLVKDEYDGIPFCTKCGLQFNDEIVFANTTHNMNNHYHTAEEEDEKEYDCDTEEETETSHSNSDTEPILNSNPLPKPNPKNVKYLVKLAKKRGIKYSTTMSKKDLCAILDIEIVKEPKIILRNIETGEERKFYSIYKATKDTGVNPGIFHYYIKHNKELRIGETMYSVRKV